MTTLVRIHRKGQMTLPTELRSLADIAEGDLVEAAFQRGKTVLSPKLVIDARLAKSDEDIKHGRVHGPFNTAAEMAASTESNIKKLQTAKKRAKPGR